MKTCLHDSGVYMLLHVPTGSAYVGSSSRSISNRLSWHKFALRSGSHTCRALQSLWSSTDESEWSWEVLEEDSENDIRERENFWMGFPKILLNTVRDATGRSRRHSEETKRRMSESRARYLETSGAREALAEKARRQHEDGNFGRATWK